MDQASISKNAKTNGTTSEAPVEAPKKKFNVGDAILRQENAPSGRIMIVKEVGVVTLGKPDKETFFRRHPDPTWVIGPVAVTEDRENYSTHIIEPSLISTGAIKRVHIKEVLLYPVLTTGGAVMAWPVRTSSAKEDGWFTSAQAAAVLALSNWIMLTAADGRYDITTSPAHETLTPWPEMTYEKYVELLFCGSQYITDPQNSLLKRRRGEF